MSERLNRLCPPRVETEGIVPESAKRLTLFGGRWSKRPT